VIHEVLHSAQAGRDTAPSAARSPVLARLSVVIREIAWLLFRPGAWYSFVSWPKFSVTSYRSVMSLHRQGLRPKTVLDVGANVGQFAVASLKIFPDITLHSFEPEPSCVRALRRNLSRFNQANVHPVALGSKLGEAVLHVNSHRHSSSILALGPRHQSAFPQAREIDSIRVSVSTLDSELRALPLRSPVLLKLDVQGYEAHVLEGATETLKRVDYVLLEASFRPLYEGEKTFMEIAWMMEDRGFEFLRPIAWLADPHNDEVLQMDALFARSGSRS
jgi:FkbM family methyltransferase